MTVDMDAVADLAVADLVHEQGSGWLASLDEVGMRDAIEWLAEGLVEQTGHQAGWRHVVRAALDRAQEREKAESAA